MSRTFVCLLAAAVPFLGLAGCKPHPVQPSAAARPPAGSLGLAPSWSLKDLNGSSIGSDQFKGKVVVLDFWATWCPPCRQEIPGYVELQKKYGRDGLVVIGVSLDQGRKGPGLVKKFVDRYEVSYQIVMGDDKVQQDFGGMDAIPTTFIIDRDGYIRDRKVGAVPEAEFEQRLLKVLKPSGSGA